MSNLEEHILKAVHSIEFSIDDMREARNYASACESMIILESLGRLVNEQQRLRLFLKAIEIHAT